MEVTIWTSVVTILLGCWFVMTICQQMRFKFCRKMTRWDIFHLLPRWTFFAPNPGTVDYHLLYRYVQNDGQMTPFLEVSLASRPRTACLFNPHKRAKKTLLDLANMLQYLLRGQQFTSADIHMSFPYLAMLNFLTAMKQPGDCVAIQYSIFMTDGFSAGQPQLLLSSRCHSVPAS